MEYDPSPREEPAAEERLAAKVNQTEGVRRRGPAFASFAEAVGHLTAVRDPELFDRSLVGVWPSMDLFVRSFAIESGLYEQVEQLPAHLRGHVGVDLERTAATLRDELLVIEVGPQVWVFDAQPVVETTVARSERRAHSGT